MARCLERPTVDPLLPRRALIEELFSSYAESRVRAAEAVFRATAACNRSLHLLDELHRLRSQARAAAAAAAARNAAANFAEDADGDAVAVATQSIATPSRFGVRA